ncbi:uncharacterized protein LOC131236768 isoform X2 [Magnolia sinica]|uniref:uncharacterized protein LOC131236768 isoform X2 n=1 Tax=Magnolia sinica TaxID=86752 RepID=UPI00265A7B31|nr:uncharacterized protein LOC131236768 isoform X2 [Magnolia sinica]
MQHEKEEEPKRSLESPTPSPKPSKIPRPENPSPAIQESMSQNPRIQRYLIAVEYIGTRFCGSQKQPNDRTVVGVLEDAGVHALSNVCHVDVERISKRKPGAVLPPHEPGVVRKAVNHFLQKNEGDIMVIDVRCVPPDFHARFKAQERTYFYRLLSGPEPLSTFEKERAWHVPKELDLVAMQKACNILVGHHDFSSFRSAGCQASSPVKTLDELHVSEVVSSPYFPSSVERRQINSFEQDLQASSNTSKIETTMKCTTATHDKVGGLGIASGQAFGQMTRQRCFIVTARARSFLYHQVRLLVGVLKAVGTGELTISDVETILNAKTITAASPMAPACGLYLGNVKYELP